MGDWNAGSSSALWAELWVSLASLLRSYSAVHGLGSKQQATVEADEARILLQHEEKWLELRRRDASIAWMRENGSSGYLKLTEEGRLRNLAANESSNALGYGAGEEEMDEEMDMAAEAWAREILR